MKKGSKFCPKLRNKCGTAVRDDRLGHAVVTENAVEEEPGETGCICCLIAWNEVSIMSEVVADDPDRVVTMRFGELDDVVHGDGSPWTIGDLQRTKETVRLVSRDLDASTSVACSNVVTNKRGDARPGIVTTHEVERLGATGMTCKNRIVTREENVSAQGLRNINETLVCDVIAEKLEVLVASSNSLAPLIVGADRSLEALAEGRRVERDGCGRNFDRGR